MRPEKPFGQGGELWEASNQGYTPEGGVDQWPGTTTPDPGGVPEPIWNAPSFAPGEWDQVPGGFGQDPKDGGGFQEPGWNPNDPQTWPTGEGNPPLQDGGGFQYGQLPEDFNTAEVSPISAMVPQDGGGFRRAASPQQQYEDAMTVSVGEDPLSQYTDQTLTNLVTSGQGVLGNEAQSVLSGILSGEDSGPHVPGTAAGAGGRAALEQMFQQGGFDPSVFRTGLGEQVQGQLGSTIAQGGELPAHQMVQQAQTQLTDLMAQGQTRQLSPSEQAMVQQLEQTIQTGGQLAQSGLAQTSEQALQNIIQQGGMSQQSEVGAQTGQQISDLLANQGRLPEDLQREAMQLEAARSPLDVMRRAQTAQGAAALADRGLVGSGAGREYLEGLEERLAPQYTQAAQQIEEQRRQADDQRYSQALGLGAQRGGQLESLQQQGMQSALGQAGQQTAQQEQLEQSERQQALGQAGQYGLGLGQQGQQQQQFGISQATQLGTQQDQMRDTRLNQAMEQAGQLSTQEVAQRQERYLSSVMAAEGINREEAMRNDQRMQTAVQQATGLDGQRVQQLLASANTIGDRQAMLSDIALQSLGQNQEWNRFLAEFGLQREQVQEAMQMGRHNAVVQLLDLYARTGQTTSTGYVPFDPDIAKRFDK